MSRRLALPYPVALFFMGRLSAPVSGASPAALAEKSIAVLPFENQNRDPDTDYLCDGIPESIINSLSELPKLKVMSRNSVFHYKGKERRRADGRQRAEGADVAYRSALDNAVIV